MSLFMFCLLESQELFNERHCLACNPCPELAVARHRDTQPCVQWVVVDSMVTLLPHDKSTTQVQPLEVGGRPTDGGAPHARQQCRGCPGRFSAFLITHAGKRNGRLLCPEELPEQSWFTLPIAKR